MRRFLLHIALFLFPFFILFILLFCFPVNKKDAYAYIANDCYDRSSWFYQRIFENNKPVDILFLGSSHTICSVRDSVIEAAISFPGKHKHVLNCGYCRLGISLQYTLLKEVCAHKKPQLVLFEVREQEDRFSHEMFPYIADTKDVFTAPLLFNTHYLNDIFTAAQNRFALLKMQLKHSSSEIDTVFSEFGFWERGETATEDELLKKQIQQEGFAADTMNNFQKYFYLHYSEMYVRRMVDLCKEKNISFLFYYIPSYYDIKGEPVNADFYRALGEIISPPSSILENKKNWSDEGHLNVTGADEITNWLNEELFNYFLSRESFSR